MRHISILFSFVFLTACGGSSEQNFDAESTGGYSFLVQIPADKYVEQLTKGYTDPQFRTILNESGNPAETLPKEFFEEMVKLSEEKDYDLGASLQRANSDIFKKDLTTTKVSDFLWNKYQEDLATCRDHLSERYKDLDCKYNLFKIEKGQFRVEFDRTIDRIEALNLIFSNSSLEFYEIVPMGDMMKRIMDIEDDLTGRDTVYYEPSSEDVVISDEQMMEEPGAEEEVLTEEQIEQQYPITSKLQFNITVDDEGNIDYTASDNPMIGFAMNSDTAYISSIFADPEYSTYLPHRTIMFWDEILEEGGTISELCGLYALKECDKFYRINPEDIEKAEAKESEYIPGQFDINIYFQGEGVTKWSSLTGANVDKYVAIVLGSRILSIPMVQQRIMGGECVISGDFDEKAATDIARAINSSHLPFPLSIVEETIY